MRKAKTSNFSRHSQESICLSSCGAQTKCVCTRVFTSWSRHTCIGDQEVHHFNSVKVDHHTTTSGGRSDKDVTWNLGNFAKMT